MFFRPQARAADPAGPPADGRPQYIFFNRAPAVGPDRWHDARPETFTRESVERIAAALGTRGNDRLRVGVSFIFNILNVPADTLAASLTRLLEACEAADVPVLVTLDGQNWWESRSDLWNWWDPNLPGYSEANRRNVEWTDWGPQHAVKIGWRNWGRQIRVRPAPNLASPRFLAEHWKAYDVLVPILVRWHARLPKDRKYLFGGVKVGWEASINVNAYYYADGNRLAETLPPDGSKDPTNFDAAQGWTFGLPGLGYAAAFTSGVRRSGALTKEDIEKVVARYLNELCRQAGRRGIPPHLLFTHQGGVYAPWEKHVSCRPAINALSIPGYSFYTHDPAEFGSLAKDLEASGRQQWAAAEWWRGAGDAAGWRRNFEASLGFKHCRFVCVYNWESFRTSPGAIEAVRELVSDGRIEGQ